MRAMLTTQQTSDAAREQARTDAQTQAREARQAVREAQAEARQAAQQSARDAAQAAADQGSMQIHMPPQPPIPLIYDVGQPNPRNSDIPREAVDMLGILGVTLVFCVIGFPIAKALARWIDRRGTNPPPASREVTTRLEAIEQAVESIAVETERISEGQRFTTRLLSERLHEPAHEFSPMQREPLPLSSPPANVRRG